jgi:diguanylate cyclase (GGDEF)-like protein
MLNSTFRHSSYLILALAFAYSLLLAGEFDLVALGAPSRDRHQGIELEELLGLSGLFSVLLAVIAVLNGRLATRERAGRTAAERTANHDPLTSIANRRLFVERLEAAVVRSRSGSPCALVLMDLDGFKAVNDIHGHGAGDSILVHAARQISALAGPGALAARLGGDEFALLIEGRAASPGRVRALVEQVRNGVTRPIVYRGAQLRVGVSAGIGFASPATMTAAALLEAADGAMYQAKRRNRGRAAA